MHNVLPPHLMLAGMPLGNPDDVTVRFLREAAGARRIICESRRVAQTLLKRHGIDRPADDFLVLDEHSDAKVRGQIIEECEGLTAEGDCAARLLQVSDAGMPIFCDPGAELLAQAEERGWTVEVLPGASALDVALVRAGLNGPFFFAGFPPREKEDRRRFLHVLGRRSETIVLYETPYRTDRLLDELRGAFSPSEKVFVGIDLTSNHEQILRFRLGDRGKALPRGAPVIILERERPARK